MKDSEIKQSTVSNMPAKSSIKVHFLDYRDKVILYFAEAFGFV